MILEELDTIDMEPHVPVKSYARRLHNTSIELVPVIKESKLITNPLQSAIVDKIDRLKTEEALVQFFHTNSENLSELSLSLMIKKIMQVYSTMKRGGDRRTIEEYIKSSSVSRIYALIVSNLFNFHPYYISHIVDSLVKSGLKDFQLFVEIERHICSEISGKFKDNEERVFKILCSMISAGHSTSLDLESVHLIAQRASTSPNFTSTSKSVSLVYYYHSLIGLLTNNNPQSTMDGLVDFTPLIESLSDRMSTTEACRVMNSFSFVKIDAESQVGRLLREVVSKGKVEGRHSLEDILQIVYNV